MSAIAPLRRMDAETLRDTMLAVTGSLNPERGGPSYLLQKKGGGGSYIYDALDNDGPPVWRRARSAERCWPRRGCCAASTWWTWRRCWRWWCWNTDSHARVDTSWCDWWPKRLG